MVMEEEVKCVCYDREREREREQRVQVYERRQRSLSWLDKPGSVYIYTERVLSGLPALVYVLPEVRWSGPK